MITEGSSGLKGKLTLTRMRILNQKGWNHEEQKGLPNRLIPEADRSVTIIKPLYLFSQGKKELPPGTC